MAETLKEGKEIYQLAGRLFPICRSITGDGVRETLKIIDEFIGKRNGGICYRSTIWNTSF